MVTVIDAVNLLKDYSSQDFLRDRSEAAGEEDDRALVDLLVERIEFADVVVLNKSGSAAPEQRELAWRDARFPKLQEYHIISSNEPGGLAKVDIGRAALRLS